MPPSLHRFLYAYANPLVYVDLFGYASYDPFLETDVSGSGRIRVAHSELLKSFSDARGIDINATESSPFGDRSLALKELDSAFSEIGINRDNAGGSAVLLVEKGDDEKSVTNYLLDELGSGFRDIYKSNSVLQEQMKARLAGVQQGDLVNISDFSAIAFNETAKRAAQASPHYADIYNNKGTVYDGSVPLFSKWLGNYGYNTAVATDGKAPKKLQDYAARSLATNLSIDAVMLGAPLKGVPKGSLGATRSTALDTASGIAKGGNAYETFYHGTSRAGASNIRANGIDLSFSRANTDFGQGFYTTKDLAQAQKWAERNAGEVLEFKVPSEEFARLSELNMETKTNSSLFRFFRHNRLGGRMHSYDVVSGPMLGNPGSFLRGGAGKAFGQQTTFHTEKAIELLNKGLQP